MGNTDCGPGYERSGNGSGFALIVVLFILLIIIGGLALNSHGYGGVPC
ncbi:YjcZ family sporulation protein [Psychrobacillus vulpis]|uniref:YjcZ family sporulation protein n=1 Tax=Psychrobacillus vulpis TaxID=2325572 RepID=A0A544TTE4_9BACI|nr:YjcZ family sporulation protein [Psychrobacillus vulpis]TQR20713.1 YjcZ family sporulation protein [Psychrobacillus vulpis]